MNLIPCSKFDRVRQQILCGVRTPVWAIVVCALLSLPSSGAEPAPPSSESPPVATVAKPTTYCNPLSLPNYPTGRLVRKSYGSGKQFRELADPTALWHEGKWYLYPSCDMAWVSADEGLTWQHHPLNVRDIGYAPTIVKHDGRFLLSAYEMDLYSSNSPLGPFEKLGKFALPKVPGVPTNGDPMLFSEDGRLYLYWGCTPRSGIWAVELDPKNPLVAISEPFCAIPFRPDTQPWEAVGNWNQNATTGYLEGSWMVKINGRYYLNYSAGGTENRTYAMGCYVGDSPLGPFTPQKRNPICRMVDGLITGVGHGCIVAGPRNRLWVFYCVRANVVHNFERRVGFDLAAIDANGELYVPEVTSLPQYLPPSEGSSNQAVSPGWLPLNDGERTQGSTDAPNLSGRLAVDNSITTWWQPAEGDLNPMLTTNFNTSAMVRSVRLIWRDIGLDTKAGVNPGPFRYRVEVETAPQTWTTVIDRSASQEDFLIDYGECIPVSGRRARLVILGAPQGITPGVVEFTVFGDKAVSSK